MSGMSSGVGHPDSGAGFQGRVPFGPMELLAGFKVNPLVTQWEDLVEICLNRFGIQNGSPKYIKICKHPRILTLHCIQDPDNSKTTKEALGEAP